MARLAESGPAIAQPADEMVPPDFGRWQSWLRPLLETLAMSIAGTALAVVLEEVGATGAEVAAWSRVYARLSGHMIASAYPETGPALQPA